MTGYARKVVSGGGRNFGTKIVWNTPPIVTQGLVDTGVLGPKGAVIWEPACGEGAISTALQANGYGVVSTDIDPTGFPCEGAPTIDFLQVDRPRAPIIVTNPPFALAEAFIRKACALPGAQVVALLLRSVYWEAAGRRQLWEDHPPARFMQLLYRPDFLGKGAAAMPCAWVIWYPGYRGSCEMSLIPKPTIVPVS